MRLLFTEHKGRNSLPPIAVGVPSGWQLALDGKPIFLPDHNWDTSLDVVYRRYGDVGSAGRKNRPFVDGERYVQVQSYQITCINVALPRPLAQANREPQLPFLVAQFECYVQCW